MTKKKDGKALSHMGIFRGIREARMQSMTTRKCLQNMIYGVSAGWHKIMYLYGKGYKAWIDDDKPRILNIRCGYAFPVQIEAPHVLYSY